MSDRPQVSVIAAVVNARETLEPWLRAIAPQAAGRRVEVLLVVAGGDPAASVGEDISFARRIDMPAGTLVPSMWGAGLALARGPIIVFTITACLPDDHWIDAIVAAHVAPHAAVGGVIDQGADGGLVDRALHLVRYTPYLPPLAAGEVPEVAGDNGSYKRDALEPFMAQVASAGFWEADINRALRGRGATLWLDPRIRVRHARSYSCAGFSRQRFVHGRVFGRTRAGASLPVRVARAALAPAVPALMLARAVRTVASRGRLDASTLIAAPLALWFFTCWATGEAVGQLGG
jgi:hypothetical protein